MSTSDFSPGHRALPRIFANPKESQLAEITQLLFQSGSKVLLLDPEVKFTKLSRGKLRLLREIHSEDGVISEVLPHCWIPVSMAVQWCGKKNISTAGWPAIESTDHDDDRLSPSCDQSSSHVTPPNIRPLPPMPEGGEPKRAWMLLRKFFEKTGLPENWGAQRLRSHIRDQLSESERKTLPSLEAFKRAVGTKK